MEGTGCAEAGNVAAAGPWQTSTSFGLLLRKQKLLHPFACPLPPFLVIQISGEHLAPVTAGHKSSILVIVALMCESLPAANSSGSTQDFSGFLPLSPNERAGIHGSPAVFQSRWSSEEIQLMLLPSKMATSGVKWERRGVALHQELKLRSSSLLLNRNTLE